MGDGLAVTGPGMCAQKKTCRISTTRALTCQTAPAAAAPRAPATRSHWRRPSLRRRQWRCLRGDGRRAWRVRVGREWAALARCGAASTSAALARGAARGSLSSSEHRLLRSTLRPHLAGCDTSDPDSTRRRRARAWARLPIIRGGSGAAWARLALVQRPQKPIELINTFLLKQQPL